MRIVRPPPPAPPLRPPSDNGAALCAWLDKDFVAGKEPGFVWQDRARPGPGRSGQRSGQGLGWHWPCSAPRRSRCREWGFFPSLAARLERGSLVVPGLKARPCSLGSVLGNIPLRMSEVAEGPVPFLALSLLVLSWCCVLPDSVPILSPPLSPSWPCPPPVPVPQPLLALSLSCLHLSAPPVPPSPHS